MRALLFSLSLIAVLAVGCDDSPIEKEMTSKTPATAPAAADADHSDLLAEVNKDALASTLVANDVTLIEFTAVW